MMAIALNFALICFGLALLCNLYRIINAAGVGDRVLALDTMVINAIALVIIYGIAAGTTMNFEAAMLIAMTGFLSTVSYARFMLRGDVIE
jgi:multicomponent K+:H+ antiporter subunit F